MATRALAHNSPGYLAIAGTTAPGRKGPGITATITGQEFELEGLRGDSIAISAKTGIEGGEEDEDMAGVY